MTRSLASICANSERTLGEVVRMTKGFCPIWISYDGQVIYDEAAASSVEDAFQMNKRLDEFVEKHKDDIVIALHIDIVEFHHALITIAGSRFNQRM